MELEVRARTFPQYRYTPQNHGNKPGTFDRDLYAAWETDDALKMSYSRTNNSTRAQINKKEIFASGTFKNAWKGTYTQGSRAGQACVAKEFKTGSVYEDHYFEEELNINRRTQKIINDFAAAKVINNTTIVLNTPEIWMYEKSRCKHLLEPMIENFEKFNSNTGWAPVTGDAWTEAMQALSHFSYHDSGGQFLLCDLQGGSYRDG